MLLALRISGGTYCGALPGSGRTGVITRLSNRMTLAGREKHSFMFMTFAFLQEVNWSGPKETAASYSFLRPRATARLSVSRPLRAELLNQAPCALSLESLLPSA